MGSQGRRKSGRKYSPRVEALEALRLLSGATSPTIASHLMVDQGGLDGLSLPPMAPLDVPTTSSDAAWDAVLAHADRSELFAPPPGPAVVSTSTAADPNAIASGLTQLDRYLARAWYRAGIPPQAHDDCTQAVYAQLLQLLGRNKFDALAADVGQNGIRDVLSRETPEGPDFFRAIDTVKKRAQREKTFQPLDGQADPVAASTLPDSQSDERGDLHEAIARRLNPREAALVYETLKGATPAEIAHQWGVAPKTVSNEKTRVFQKLREALVSD